MTAKAERRFRAQAGDLPAIDEFVEAFGKRAGLSERVVFRARVCIAELAANALEHGQARSDVDRIEIEVASDGAGRLTATYADTTAPFDPTAPERDLPDPQDSRVGGRGLKIVQDFADGLAYRRDGSRNVTQLRFEGRGRQD